MDTRWNAVAAAVVAVLSACKPPEAPPAVPPPASAPQPPAAPVSREADPEPQDEILPGGGAVVPPELQAIDGAIGGYAWVPAGEVLEAVQKARESGEISFAGPMFLLTRHKDPAVADAARRAMEGVLSGVRKAPPESGSADRSDGALETALIERIRPREGRSRYFNIRKAVREELAKASVVVVRPDVIPPPLCLIVDHREWSGDAKYEETPFGVSAETSVVLSLHVWVVDARGPRVLGWFAASAEARPRKAREGELHSLSAKALTEQLAENGLGSYVLAAAGRRSEFSRLLIRNGLTDELRALAGSLGDRPERPGDKAWSLSVDKRYRDCARLGKEGLERLLSVYKELSYRDDSEPEYEVAEAIASAEGPEAVPVLRDMVIHFPQGTLLDTPYLRIDHKTAVLLLGRLAEIGEATDAQVVAPWTDAKWPSEISGAARKAKAALEAKGR